MYINEIALLCGTIADYEFKTFYLLMKAKNQKVEF